MARTKQTSRRNANKFGSVNMVKMARTKQTDDNENVSSTNSNNNLASHFEEKNLNDVKFIIEPTDDGEVEIIPAFKTLLIARSKVFATMFSGEWLEKDTVTITDISATTFRILIYFIYENNISIGELDTSDYMQFSEIIYAARKYQIQSLEDMASACIVEQINENEIYEILEVFSIYENVILRKCEEYYEKHTNALMTSDSFKCVDLSMLEQILNFKKFSIDEYDLFKKVLKWAESECIRSDIEINSTNKRIVLGDIHKKIRFHQMSENQFQKLINEESEYFNDEEVFDIKKEISSILRYHKPKSLEFEIFTNFDSSDYHSNRTFEDYVQVKFSKNVTIFGLQLNKCTPNYLCKYCYFSINKDNNNIAEIYYIINPDDDNIVYFNKEVICNANEIYFIKNVRSKVYDYSHAVIRSTFRTMALNQINLKVSEFSEVEVEDVNLIYHVTEKNIIEKLFILSM